MYVQPFNAEQSGEGEQTGWYDNQQEKDSILNDFIVESGKTQKLH